MVYERVHLPRHGFVLIERPERRSCFHQHHPSSPGSRSRPAIGIVMRPTASRHPAPQGPTPPPPPPRAAPPPRRRVGAPPPPPPGPAPAGRAGGGGAGGLRPAPPRAWVWGGSGPFW